MSGHNPHSRVSQPVNSSSWNHLQVPYALQPQLAHMSNDRTLRSSPLIWPNTNPADAFYNYMALTAAAVANSNPKNSLDINPLLPFVRTPANSMPFNSVDLSLPSSSLSIAAEAIAPPAAHTNRNSLTPSPRTQISPVSGGSLSSNNRFASKHQNDHEDSITNNGANRMDNNKLNTDPIAFLHEMSEQLASMRSTRNLTASANFSRDSNSFNSDLSNFRNNGGNDKQLQQRTEPMELVKEHPNPFENESLSQSVHLQQLLGLAVQTQQHQHQHHHHHHHHSSLPLPPSTTSSITPNLNDLTKMLSIINNTTSPTSPSLLISPKSSSTPSSRQGVDTQTKNCLNTSTDDSLDSQSTPCNGGNGGGGGGDDASPRTRYRRRKPQKTIRMSNELNAIDSAPGPLDNDRTNAIKHDHSKHDTNHSNGLSFPPFHADTNSILNTSSSNSAGMRPPQTQTQSMDLSHHHTELFENGLVNYSKSNTSLDLTHTNALDNGHCNAAKDLTNTNTTPITANTGNLLPANEMNSLNLFGSFGHLRGTNLTNDIATFPNTDDLVKKVEELVKCNEQNGFGNNDFGPMELIKSHANKLVSDAYDSTRLSNGLMDSTKMTNSVEHSNNHAGTTKHNGNGLLTEIEDKLHENNHDSIDTSNTMKMLSNGNQVDNSNRNGGIKALNSNEKPSNISHGIDSVMSSEFTGIGPVTDMMYEKMSEEITNNQSSLNKNFTVNTPQQNNSSSYNGNSELTKEALLTSSNDATPSNPLPAPPPKSQSKPSSSSSSSSSSSTSSTSSSSSSASKKKTNINPTNKKNSNRSGNKKPSNKPNTGRNSNQKNAKSKNKSDKKRDINEKKKTKSTTIDDSASGSVSSSSTTTEQLNKFRGPYVHVSRNGTVEVINAPLNEEVSEKQIKLKKSYISQRPTSERNKVRGLHVSTLSNKYDAITTDISWMCVFCKLGPHKFGLGDLFGPFILPTEGEDFQSAQLDPKDDQKLTVATTKSMPKSATTGNATVKKKRKLNQIDTNEMTNVGISNPVQSSQVDIFYGMTRAIDNSYEVWAHEDCIVWASGVHIIGARVIGLETAVWGSVRHQCSVCKQYGAMLSCLQRSCSDEVHVPCAKRCNWHLDEHSFQSRCSEHGNNDVSSNTNPNETNN